MKMHWTVANRDMGHTQQTNSIFRITLFHMQHESAGTCTLLLQPTSKFQLKDGERREGGRKEGCLYVNLNKSKKRA